jgi:hypothetical protein
MPAILVEQTAQYRATLKVALANPAMTEAELAVLCKASERTIRRYRKRAAWKAAVGAEAGRRAEAAPDEFALRASKAVAIRKAKRKATGEKFDLDRAADEALEVCADIVAAGAPGFDNPIDVRVWTACLSALVKIRSITRTAEVRDHVTDEIGAGDFRLIETEGRDAEAA